MSMRDSIVAARLSGPEYQAPAEAIFEFRFRADDPTFAGHFPSHALLPGVFQLEMTRTAAEWVLDCSLAVREVRKAKFQRPIFPMEIVRLELKLSEAAGAIRAHADFSVGGQKTGETTMTLCRNE
jgi:3-hydroxymyristoyl/3-hydroxydecanoyl-(acyl carrier protein) dehydratase